MNLPADPKERKRITAAVLQNKFSKQQPTFQASCSVIHENEPIEGNDNYRRWQTQQVIDRGRDANSNSVQYCRPSVLNSRIVGNRFKYFQHSDSSPADRGKFIDSTNIENHSALPHVNQLSVSRHKPMQTRCRKKIAPLCTGEDYSDNLAEDLKKRLSLPSDTSIPENFLNKFSNKLIESNGERPLTRADRRESLLGIGFGKINTYKKLNVLGSGTYSIVYKGTSRLLNKFVALKEIHLEREEGVPFTAIREISLLKKLKHNNIITLHDIIYDSITLILVFEYVDRDLSRYMDDCNHEISLDNVKLFLFQLLRALKYCHDRKVLHRDIKPQNILINDNGELKLADFGLARAKSFPTRTYTDEVVTLWYRPPDILLGNVDYGTSIDMWGVGCIFFEMVAGFTLFVGIDPKKQIGSIFEIIGTPSEDDWPTIKSDLRSNDIDIPHYQGRDLASITPRLGEDGIDILSLLLKCNPRLRISSSDALHHRYFQSFPKEIYDLDDSSSVFTIRGLHLTREPGCRSINSLHSVKV